jgi:hypothetical protein
MNKLSIRLPDLLIEPGIKGRRCRQKWVIVFDQHDRPIVKYAAQLKNALTAGYYSEGHYCYSKTVRGQKYNTLALKQRIEFHVNDVLNLWDDT